MSDLTVYFVAPEQDVVGDGENWDMWVAATSAQEAVDLYAAGIDCEIEDPVRVYRTLETIDGPPRMLDWDGRRDLYAQIDWDALPVETATTTYRYPVAQP